MKEYKYNINGNDYEVTVEGIENNVATVIVNGITYSVKLPEVNFKSAACRCPNPMIVKIKNSFETKYFVIYLSPRG